MACIQLLSCCCLETSLNAPLRCMSLWHNSPMKSAWLKGLAPHIPVHDFPERSQSEKYAPAPHNPPCPLCLGCIRSTAQRRQSTHGSQLPHKLSAHGSVERVLWHVLCTSGRRGWDCLALCSCIGGNGTWVNSPSGKNYEQNRPGSEKARAVFHLACDRSR